MTEFLIPVKEEKLLNGRWSIKQKIHVTIERNLEEFLSDLKEIFTPSIIKKSSYKKSDILFICDRSIKDPEGYQLEISKDKIIIKYSKPNGAFYAIQTLGEILNLERGRIRCRKIKDEPIFRRRGIYLDCSRGKVPKIETLKGLVSLFSKWKINELQLYIENVFKFPSHPDIGKGFSPFTAEEIKELKDFCNKRFIRLVPSLASFGHMEKILMLPDYRELGEKPGFNNLPGGTTLNPLHPGAIKLLKDLYNDFLPLFDDTEDFNICGDEPWELGEGASYYSVKRKGLGKVYLDFILKIKGLCDSFGKRMNMWSDIILNHPETIKLIPKDIVMLNWDYDPKTANGRMNRHSELSKEGFSTMCCTGTNAWSSHGSRLETAIRNVTDFAYIGLNNSAEGILHTDWGDAGHRNTISVSLCSMAHAAGHAWNTKAMNNKDHVERFAFHVFKDKSFKLASYIRALGDISSGSWAYYSIVESLKEEKQFGSFFGMGWPQTEKQRFSEKKIKERIDELKKLDFMKFTTDSIFLNLRLEEYNLATFMEKMAWERLSILKKIRKNIYPETKILKKHRDDFFTLKEKFKNIWLKSNKRSRLQDNIDAFNLAILELEKLIN